MPLRGNLEKAYQRTLENRHWLETQLARHTYKPGWTFEIIGCQVGWIIRTRFDTLDSRNPANNSAQLTSQYMISDFIVDERDEAAFTTAWSAAIDMAERHETDEWRRRDGSVINDPHRNDPNYTPAPHVSRETIKQAAPRVKPRPPLLTPSPVEIRFTSGEADVYWADVDIAEQWREGGTAHPRKEDRS